MPEFKINKIAYTWKGDWTTDTFYKRDDVVKYGGKSYVSVRTHTAQADFYDDLYYVFPGDTAQSPAWVKMTDGYEWRGTWSSATKYNLGDIIGYSGGIYICIADFTSTAVFEDNESSLVEFVSGQAWTEDWTVGTRYGVGDIVKYNGMVYSCITGHTSAGIDTGLEADQAKWETLYEGIEFRGEWDNAVRYRLNDLIRYGGSIFRCNTGHTSGDNITNAYWDVELPGFIFGGTWNTDSYYAIGDLVLHGGYLYYSRTNNTGKAPGDLDVGPANWKVVSKGTNFRGTWASVDVEGDKVYYKTGDVVRRGGQLYIATMDSSADGSSLDYLDAGFWEVMIPGDEWRNYWITGSTYTVGDVVIFDGSNYRCSYAHIADDQNFPGDNGSGYVYWDLLTLAGPNTGLRTRGDVLTYDLTRTVQGDGSSFGVTAVEIGDIKEILTIEADDSLYYKSFNELSRGRYIAPNGTDDPTRGNSPFKPWKTIRYACEQVLADNFSGHTNIVLAAGVYEEILPIIVPKRTALVGILGHGDLRAVTVKPNDPIASLANDTIYRLSILDRMRELIPGIVRGIPVIATETNHMQQVIPTAVSDAATGLYIQNLNGDIQDYINFYLNSQGVEPVITSSNVATTDTNKLLAVDILEDNKEFLVSEILAFMAFFYPLYTFDSAVYRRDIEAYVDAWKYDLTYEGNYRSVYSARYYRNAVLGSETEDMFYVRDASGVRNMTLNGLNGALNPANVYGLFRRPTGGSFISLDPGWGPDDESTWISNRSPYIQNITTFGYASVGQKIDGSLHNGGNKSITSNDFTQVISDGVGAWVLNGGRAELVSVFTYYAQVGYLAEDGGKIRSLNGNNSYGFIGALAVGNDPTETPKFGTINNRNNDAKVASAFAGEANDEILIFEFDQAGQNYTTATYNIVGSGTNAAVIQEEFRDNAIHFPKLINPQDSSIPGGSGYVVAGNNAQGGDLTSISIANSDENEEANYKGLRIIITSGSGTGQYGVVESYNTLTKVITVTRESDGQAGWDHVIPGYPLANPITSSATYRIEPRPIFSAAPYEARLVGLPVATLWNAITYGETTETFTNVQGTAGEGVTIEVPYTVAAWNVTKTGRTYTVVLGGSTGAGYEAGQTVTLSGDDVGGVTPDNDITITINTISNDSTNSILTFSYSGIGASGKFVITPATGTSAIASTNGADWVDSTLPSDRNWKSVAAGLNRFVAVSYGSNAAASSNNGLTWTARSMPASRQWNAVAFGGNRFVAVSGNLNSAAYSINGTTWISATMPTVGDSTINEWVDITYGLGKFVAVANSNNVIAVSTDGISWAGYLMDTIDDSSQRDWVSVAYGNNRFVAMSSQGDVAYSFDSTTWYPATMPSPDGSTRMNWKKLKYAQGVFFALCDTGSAEIGGDATTGPTRYAATSPDGIQWTNRTLNNELSWGNLAFGNPDISLDDSTLLQTGNNTGTWILIADSSTGTSIANRVYTGATAKGRVVIASGRAGAVKLWDPGSGYTDIPELTIFDPNASTDAFWDCRVADGVLAQPSWLNRGLGYKTSSTRITVSGDGFADIIPANRYLTLSGLERYPGPGAQLRIDGNNELYTAVVITPLLDVNAPGLSAYFQISPNFDVSNGPLHGTVVEIRERYSQCRITGHDFLDIGTGNFEETNYPELYSTGLFFSAPENEIVEIEGGRVFYTSTDQSGNFRAGELFAVEQATGVVTISADYFDLQGLSELSLGGVRLGGSGAVVREFSTDALFTEDSNNIVPTQRAIKSYLANRLSVGGADIATASFIAGVVKVGPDSISNTINQAVIIPVRADFEGADVEIFGTIMAQQMFFKSFKDRS